MVLFALHELRRHVADEPMIGMPRSSFRTEGDDRRWLNASDDRAQLGAQTAQGCERGESAILQPDEMQLRHAQSLHRALSLQLPRSSERRTSWDSRMVANALGAIGGDDEMYVASFAAETGKERADYTFVVGMGKDSEQRTIGWNNRLWRYAGDARDQRQCGHSDRREKKCAH